MPKRLELQKKHLRGWFDSSQREKLDAHLKDTREKHQEALLELKSIEQFNHTRFLEQKELTELSNQQGKEEEASAQESNLKKPSIKDLKTTPHQERGSSANSDFNPPP